MYLVFDIGGTHLRAARSSDLETLEEFTKVHSEKDFTPLISQITQISQDLSASQNLEAVMIGIAGTISPDKSQLLSARNLPGLNNTPLKATLEQALNTKVYLENDAALAGLGEAHFGPGVGHKIVACLTIGTGVGGVRIVDGDIDQNTLGFEPGHMIIDAGKSLEDLISGTAIKKNYGTAPEDLRDEKVWEQISKHLAVGLNNIIVEWSPEIIILGGSVTNSLNLELVQHQLQQIYTLTPTLPPVVKSGLGDQSALLGGLVYLKNLQ